MEEDKITYARKFLLDLLEKRRLRSWCQESGALHISMFKIARGLMNPTYAVMCHLLPYIPPAHWVYFTDEKIPYEVRTLPEWRPEAVSAFVRCHKRDWKEIGQRYGISESLANNIFVSHRARPTVSLIRNAREDVNPEDFFTGGDLTDDGLFYPERGDIVTVQGRTVLVISTEKRNREMSSVTVFDIKNGEIDCNTLATIHYARTVPMLVGKADSVLVEKAIQEVRKILE